MNRVLEPLRATRLTEEFLHRFEELILSGRLAIGERLPSERALAEQLGVSRPTVHEGLVELAARGLVTIQPRVGTVVNDYRRQGSLALLSSLLSYRDGNLAPDLLLGLLALRRLVETEAAREAARRRTRADLDELQDIVAAEERASAGDSDTVTGLDFRFHHSVALASGNPVFAMALKSCEPAHRNLAGRFFEDPAVVPEVFGVHRAIVAAIDNHDSEGAGARMDALLQHGHDLFMASLAPPEAAAGEGR